jgi:L-arabinose isomerase
LTKTIDEVGVRKRLSGLKSEEEIEDLIDKYGEAMSLEKKPNMNTIVQLVEKGREERRLSVRFKLEKEQFDALAAYFEKDENISATVLVQEVIDEFFSLIA